MKSSSKKVMKWEKIKKTVNKVFHEKYLKNIIRSLNLLLLVIIIVLIDRDIKQRSIEILIQKLIMASIPLHISYTCKPIEEVHIKRHDLRTYYHNGA